MDSLDLDMAGANDETNQANNDGAERRKPPKSAENSVDTSTVASQSDTADFDESMRAEKEKTEAAIRAGVALEPVQLEQLGVDSRVVRMEPLQSREQIERSENPLSAQELRRLEDGRQRFFEPGLDERSRLVALRDSFDSIAAGRGAADSKGIIREGRDLIGLSNYLKISEALTTVDGGRAQDPQKKESAARQLTESLEEIKRLSYASPPGSSALKLQHFLGGHSGLDSVLKGLKSNDPIQRDAAIAQLAKAVSTGDGWSADNALTREFYERRQSEHLGDANPIFKVTGVSGFFEAQLAVGNLNVEGDPTVRATTQYMAAVDNMRTAQRESRVLMQQNGLLDRDGEFQLKLGERTGKPEALTDRVTSVTPYMLNPQLMLPTPGDPRGTQNPLEQLLRTPGSRPHSADMFKLDGRLNQLDSRQNPFGDFQLFAQHGGLTTPPWLSAAEGVRDLSSATNSLQALGAFRKLSELARNGDQHAKNAIATTFLALTTGNEGLTLAQNSIASNNPVFAPDLSRLDAQSQATLRSLALRELTSSGLLLEFSDRTAAGQPVLLDLHHASADLKELALKPSGLSKEVLTCLAIAVSSPSNLTDAERATAQGLLARDANTDNGAYAILSVLSARGAQKNEALEQMLVSGLNGRRGDYFLDFIAPAAKAGDQIAQSIIGRALGREGMEPEKSARCFEILKQAAEKKNPNEIARMLLEQHTKYGDDGDVLNLLGTIAQDGKLTSENTNSIMNVLRKEIASGDSDTHESAVKGFMQLSSRWTSSDLRLLADNVSDATVSGIREVVSSATPESAKALSERLVANLRAGRYVDINQQAAAVTALGVLADYAPESTAKVIKEAVTAQRFAGEQNVGADADKLTMAGVHSLMRIAGSRGAASEFALDQLREPGLKNTANLQLEKDSVRGELADFVTGRVTRADMSPETKAATFNSGFPISLHSILREQGVRAESVNELVERARNHYSDETIRSVLTRVELYNALPQDLRARMLGGATNPRDFSLSSDSAAAAGTDGKKGKGSAAPHYAERIDMISVFGQMGGGNLENSENGLLLNPLGTRVQKFSDEIARQRREVSEEFRTNETEVRDRLTELTDHTAKGVTTWEFFKGNFGGSVRAEFYKTQEGKLDLYNKEVEQRGSLNTNIRTLSADHQAFSIALDAANYRMLRNSGKEGEADRLALSMMQKNGPALATFAPEIWQDLGMVRLASGETVVGTTDGESIWQRLQRQNLARTSEAPVLVLGKDGAVVEGIKELSVKRNATDLDMDVRRQLALLKIEYDPTIGPLKETAIQMQAALPELDKLFRAGLEGTRGKQFVEDVRSKVAVLDEAYTRMNAKDAVSKLSPLDRTKESLQKLRDSLPNLDPETQEAVSDRIHALEKMIAVFDPESQTGMNIKLLIDKVKSNDFDESGFFQWLQGEGAKTIGAVGLAVVAAFAVASMLPSFGASAPLAAAAVTAAVAAGATLGGIVGYELTAELLYQTGAGDRTGAQVMHARRGGVVDGEGGNAKRLTQGEVWSGYGSQFVKGYLISLATMGAGAALGKGISSIAGNAFSRAATAESQALARIGARAAQLESAAERVGGQELKKRWMSRLAHEFGQELAEEGTEKGAEIGVEQVLGEVNPALSIFVSALIASKGGLSGFDLHPKRGGTLELELDQTANATETMSALRDQMLKDGLQVEWNGRADSAMTVKTPEGYSINLKSRTAETPSDATTAISPDAADATSTGSAVTPGSAALAKLSRANIDAPPGVTDIKAMQLAKLEAAMEPQSGGKTDDKRAARLKEIEDLKGEIRSDFKQEAVSMLSKATGLPPQDARAIVEGLNIQLKPYSATSTSAGAFKNSDGTLTMFVGGDMPEGVRPEKTFVHEFAHELDAARYSALHAANPPAFVNALVSDVVNNSFTGKTGIWDKPGAKTTSEMLYTRMRVGENGLTESDVKFARETLGDYLRQNAPDGKLPTTPTEASLAAWIQEHGGMFPDSKHEASLLREMVREISHANTVMAESQLGADAMKNPAVQQMVQAFVSSTNSDPIVVQHAMRGISDATTAMADSTHYDFGSRYENRANRLQARTAIEVSQNAMPELTQRLFEATKNDPKFADLNAKLQSLLGSGDDKTSRRAGVRQSEFFASPEGQTELARLQEDSVTRWTAGRINDTVRSRQHSLTQQRFLTALDMLPSRRAALDDAPDDVSAVRAQQEHHDTLVSLFANAKADDLPRLTKFLESNGLASGEQILNAFSANSASTLSAHDNATMSRVVQALESPGLSRKKIFDALSEASANSPALQARLSELSTTLPPPVELQQTNPSIAGRWRISLDSLLSIDTTGAIGRFNHRDTQSAIGADIESLVADWVPSSQKIDNLRMVQDRAEHAAKQETAWKALGPDAAAQTEYWTDFGAEMESVAAKISQELAPEISHRAEALEASLNRTLSAHNLPPATIAVASVGASTTNGALTQPARFNPVTGKIEVSPALLLNASPEHISAAVRTEYEKSLAHNFTRAVTANQNSTQAEKDAATRINDMFARQASADAKVDQLTKQAEMLADNQRLLLSEGGVRTLLGRMSAPGANIESILGVAPPPELNNLVAKFQQARKPDGTLDSKKWSMDSDQEVSRLLFPSVYRANVQARTDLQGAMTDRPATAGELAYDRAGIESKFVDAIATTDFSPDYGTQLDQRIGLAMDHSWAIPDRASLSAIYDFAGKEGIVEVGAGKGLWAGALRRMGVDVSAYDINANNVDGNFYHRGQSVSTVEQGGIEKAGAHPNKTLLLSWPTPGEAMAADALKAYTEAGGTKLAFIGERPTPGSNMYNTGDSQFHQTLNDDWVLTGVVDMPHVPDGTNLSTSKLYLYERRGTTSHSSEANVDTNTDADGTNPDLLKESRLSDGSKRYLNDKVSPIIAEHKNDYKPVQFVTADGEFHIGSTLCKIVGEVEKGKFESGLFVELEETTIAAPGKVPQIDELAAIPGTRGLYRDHDGYVWKVDTGKPPVFQNDMAIITADNIHNPVADSVSANAAKMKELNNRELKQDQFREQLIDLLENSPELDYTPDTLVDLNRRQHQYLNAINDPIGSSDYRIISSNCKDCVAALYRTLHEGRIVRASDVSETIGPNGKKIGHLGPMEIEDHSEMARSAAASAQMEWLAQAAGTQKLKPVSLDELAAVEKATGATEFVVVVKIDSDTDHVIYASRQATGSMTYFDPQSGLRWSQHSIEKANPTYYPMHAQADPVNPEVANRETATPELLKESKLRRNPSSIERSRPEDEEGHTRRIKPPDSIQSFDRAPKLDFAASKHKMRESGANSEDSVDMLSVLSDYRYRKKGRSGAEYANALEQTEFFRQFRDSITEAEVVGEGNESVVMKVKGPFVLGEGKAQFALDEMVVKLSKPLRGEWHPDWGNWEKRPWDALTISRENVDGIDVYLQEATLTDIAPEHEELFRKALKAYNKAYTADGDDRYVLWDGDDRGEAGKQFGYSSLPARPYIDKGSVWLKVNGQPLRVVLLDHWAVKPYGEDGKAEFE
ncbi:MAG: hypothetical protein IT342_21490 [Candidatus Melainabacteria bacterium]|nr:hypothetical protein [Candidatus Melainabacteria bacterium]